MTSTSSTELSNLSGTVWKVRAPLQGLTTATGLAWDASTRKLLVALVISASCSRLREAGIMLRFLLFRRLFPLVPGQIQGPRLITSSAVMRGNLVSKSSEMTSGRILLTSRSTARLQYLATCTNSQTCDFKVANVPVAWWMAKQLSIHLP